MLHRASGIALLAAVGLLVAATPATQGGAETPFTLPPPDARMQAALDRVLQERPYRRLVTERRLSVALIDITDEGAPRYARLDDNRMRYAASLPKIAILLGVFDQVERGSIRYTPGLRSQLEAMIRRSDNAVSSQMIALVGFENIAQTLQDPRHQLYDPARRGGLWVGRGYGGIVGLWRRDPLANISHAATARQAARFLAMLDRGELVSSWASAEMKSILAHPEIHHKFVLGLENARPDALIFRKSGTWRNFHADAALVERAGRKYVAVALLESPGNSSQGVLASLIVRLDDIVFQTAVVADRAQ